MKPRAAPSQSYREVRNNHVRQALARRGVEGTGPKVRGAMTAAEVDLDCLLASAQRCGALKGACAAKKMSWAAFYKELEIMNHRKAEFLIAHLGRMP